MDIHWINSQDAPVAEVFIDWQMDNQNIEYFQSVVLFRRRGMHLWWNLWLHFFASLLEQKSVTKGQMLQMTPCVYAVQQKQTYKTWNRAESSYKKAVPKDTEFLFKGKCY